ncbi:oxygenase MpaB family protein [Rhodopseudomonas telluris]|uniref:Oxygenase MpaB family protein n=1 Tax=Rhodopseudomonas telluris TaxID=644215 RepID=A0ABV6ET44_9BRAD
MIDSLVMQVTTPDELAAPEGSPELAEAQRTAWRLAHIDFPWDINKALEFALLRTYAVPSISGLLARTGEFSERVSKRYDDTALLIREVLRNGLDSERARRAFGRINAMHGRYRIANDDYLYVLSTFVFSPIDWVGRFGHRPMTAAEQHLWFVYWNEFGRRMGIDGLSPDIASFRAFADEFERKRFVYAPSNRLISERTIDLVLSDYFVPRILHRGGRQIALAIVDRPLVEALGFKYPSVVLRGIATGALGLRRAILKLLPKRRAPKWQEIGGRTYPEGYNIEELGTFPRAKGV